MQTDQVNRVDAAIARTVEERRREIARLRHDIEGAAADVTSALDYLHDAREREGDFRARLLVVEQQLWQLQHPAAGIVVGVDVHASASDQLEQVATVATALLAETDQGRSAAEGGA